MIRHKYIDRICILVCILAIVLTIAFMNGKSLGIVAKNQSNYESKLFDDSEVHTIDIIIDENSWNEMVQNASDKEYIICDIVIDGEAFNNVAIRTKGNSSLSMVERMNTDRYSLKIEFDHYDNSQTYYGLDKLSLNNIIQDTTYMKDYLAYHMMNEMGVPAPLSSFVNISINGENFGLYVAVEGIEEAFIERNFGSISGNLYKPEGAEGENRAPIGGNTGSNSASLKYIDDNLDSYNTIWESAIFDITDSDKYRLMESLEKLNAGEDLDEVVNIDEVLKYFVVHNYLLNFDSYTASMLHNYYLYEVDGQMYMLPWDYNLSFGAFSMGIGGSFDATELVNYPIDTPVVNTTLDERPMLGKLLEVPEYLDLYHQYFDEFISEYFESGKFEEEFDRVVNLISPYVENDPTSFYGYEAFEKGVETLKEFSLLRAESIRGQLDGSIPSTTEGQLADTSSLINADHLSISDMGDMNGGGNIGERQNRNRIIGNEENNLNVQPNENMREQQNNLGIPPNENGEAQQGNLNIPPNADREMVAGNAPPMDRRNIIPQDNQNIQNPVDNNLNPIYWLLGSIVTLILGTIFVIKYKKL